MLLAAVVWLAPPSPGMRAAAGGAPAPTARAALVRLPFPQDDGTLTPYTFELGYALMTLVYDTLFWRDADGVPQPWLARAVDTSADGRELTVHLVDKARWHDGVPVTAADVAFTLAFVADRPHPRFTPEVSAVERTEVVDPLTVKIKLRHQAPGFADQPLADLPILPAHLWEGLSPAALAPDGLPVGSGPYRLVARLPGGAYRFEANADYFRGAPAVQALEVPIIGDAEETLRTLERGAVDMLPMNLTTDAATRVDDLGTRVVDGPSYLGTALLFNQRQPPFDRPEVRRAVSEALDLTRIARAVEGAVAADRGYVHPASPWASPKVVHVFDEPAARAGLAASAIGPVIVLAPDNDPVRLEAGRQVVAALQRAGARAELRPVPRRDLSKAVGEDGSPPSFQVAIWSVPALASYDPDFLARLFGTPPADGSLNYTGYRSAAFDALAGRIASTADRGARLAAVTEMLQLLATDPPAVPLFFPSGRYAYRPSVYENWVYVKGSGILDKRSFLEAPAVPHRAGRVRAPAGEAPEKSSTGLGPLGVLAMVAVAVAVVLGVWLAVSSLQNRRRRP